VIHGDAVHRVTLARRSSDLRPRFYEAKGYAVINLHCSSSSGRSRLGGGGQGQLAKVEPSARSGGPFSMMSEPM
jgi:hypothetical protein